MKSIPMNVLILSIFLFPSIFILNSCDDKNQNTNQSKDNLSQPHSTHGDGHPDQEVVIK